MNFLKPVFILFALHSLLLANAQEDSFRITPGADQNFFQIQQEAETYFGNPSVQQIASEGDSDFIRYKRWEWFWKDRVLQDGSFPDLLEQKRIYDELCETQQSSNRDLNSPWTNINQTSGDGGYNGMGRAAAIAFHPTDPDIYYVGAPIGGIWKTMDGGLTYAALGDQLPYVSVGNICIDHQNPEIIYITIGDSYGWWNYGLGVYKSIDGGLTWLPTTNTWSFTNSVAFQKMAINPLNSNELFVAQTNGLYRTQDGGDSWELVRNGSYRDVVFQPGSGTSLYAASEDYWNSSEVYKSQDNGDSWFAVTNFDETGNYLNITVTPADDQKLGIQSAIDGNAEFYESYDGGLNVHFVSNMPDNGVIYYSPSDDAKLYCGFIVVYGSIDGGSNWDQITDWYDSGLYTEVHADNRFVSANPLTNELYFCNDGGVYRYNESNGVWTELTSGLIITQYYRIAVSQQDENFMIGGTQDNGGRKRIAPGVWSATNGGDAMEVAINYEDDQTIYTTYIYGTLYRSYDQWQDDTYDEITPSQTNGGQWVTPYALSPNDPSILFAGYEEVYRSYNEGESWTALSSNLTGNEDNDLTTLAIAPSNGDVIYATRNNTLYYTIDGGDTWNDELIGIGIAGGAASSSITVHPTDESKIWVTYSGYAGGKKIFYSQNYGQTFSNVTYNLPNIPVNTSIIDKESANYDLYVGTDVGVFVFNTVTLLWEYFGAGLPNTSVTDLEIQYSSRKLRAATHGRGVWENDLHSEPSVSVFSKDPANNTIIEIAKNPIADVLTLNVHSTQHQKGKFVIYNLEGKIVFTEMQNLPTGNYQVLLPLNNLTDGYYLIEYVGDSNNIPAMKFIKQ